MAYTAANLAAWKSMLQQPEDPNMSVGVPPGPYAPDYVPPQNDNAMPVMSMGAPAEMPAPAPMQAPNAPWSSPSNGAAIGAGLKHEAIERGAVPANNNAGPLGPEGPPPPWSKPKELQAWLDRSTDAQREQWSNDNDAEQRRFDAEDAKKRGGAAGGVGGRAWTTPEEDIYNAGNARRLHEGGAADQAAINAKATGAAAEATAMAEGQRHIDAVAITQRRNKEQRDSEIRAGIDKNEAAFAELSNQKVDPDAYYGKGDAGVANRIIAGVAIALGEFGSHLNKSGHNTALDIVNRNIDHNIDAQKANFANKRAGLENQRSALGMRMQAYGNMDAAAASLRADELSRVNAKVLGIAANTKSDVVKANAMKFSTDLEQSIADQKQEIYKTIQQRKTQAATAATAAQAKITERAQKQRDKIFDENVKSAGEAMKGAPEGSRIELTQYGPMAVGPNGKPLGGGAGANGATTSQVPTAYNEQGEVLSREPVQAKSKGGIKRLDAGSVENTEQQTLLRKLDALSNSSGAWGRDDVAKYEALRAEAIAKKIPADAIPEAPTPWIGFHSGAQHAKLKAMIKAKETDMRGLTEAYRLKPGEKFDPTPDMGQGP